VVDLTGNNEFGIFMSRPTGEEIAPMLYGFHPDGSMMDGFPITKSGGLEGFSSIADVDGDGNLEIIFGSNLNVFGQGFIHAYHLDGSGQLPGFPLRPTGFTFMNGANLGDIDGDGFLDLVALSYEQNFLPTDSVFVNAYSLEVAVAEANVLAGTYKGDNSRRGFRARTNHVGLSDQNQKPMEVAFQNPATKNLVLQQLNDVQQIVLSRLSGEVVKTYSTSGSPSLTISVSDLSNGVYLLSFRTANGSQSTRKVVVIN
jgi:hypothetical protein